MTNSCVPLVKKIPSFPRGVAASTPPHIPVLEGCVSFYQKRRSFDGSEGGFEEGNSLEARRVGRAQEVISQGQPLRRSEMTRKSHCVLTNLCAPFEGTFC